ncbi:MAG: hypothetical protein ACRENS_07870, partial [Candidatus Eiseniibacteriota bacterium]
SATPPSHGGAVNAIIASMLRLGMRDFRRALAHDGNRLEGPARDLWAMRTIGWLRPAQLRRVNRLIHHLWRGATRTESNGRLYAVTVLLTPLDHRANPSGRRPRKSGRRPQKSRRRPRKTAR